MGPLGCGIQTGASAVLNVLRPEAGSSIAIFGSGAVSMSGLLAAVLATATTIIAIDKLVKTYDFADINEAFADSESGVTLKPVVIF